MSEKDKVVGKALYTEYRSNSATFQLLITPDGITSSGKNVPAVLYRRNISASRPRRPWRHTSLPGLNVDEFGVYTKEDSLEKLNELASNRLTYIQNYFKQLNDYKYYLYKTPLTVEVSLADLDEIRLGKTPYKILGRITRCRKASGFSEELFA